MSDPYQRSKDHVRQERLTVIERLRSMFGIGGASVREDLEEALDDSSQQGDISIQERAMLKNVLNLHEIRVSDVMVPRGDIVAVSLDDDLRTVLAVFRRAGHSRIPVYHETLDDPRGMIHIRDFLNCVATGVFRKEVVDEGQSDVFAIDLDAPLSNADIIRPVLFVPPSMPALDLLIKMQTARTHMALVIDEYGGTDGLASIEDIVEMIVGDIEDEHDESEGPLIAETEDGYVIDARAHLDEVAKATQLDLSTLPHADEVDTIGGIVTTIAGRVPAKGETYPAGDGLVFEILDADPRRIKKLMLRIAQPASRSAVTDPANTEDAAKTPGASD